MKLKYPLVLASNSPRRQSILRELGIEFIIRTIDIPEVFPPWLPVDEIPGFIARRKAEAFDAFDPSMMILTADTIVTSSGKILGKPKDDAEASEMLLNLSGKPHKVYTGVCLRIKENFHTITDCTEVFFKKLSKKEIEYYIHHYMPLDKAGAYGIQEWIGMIGIKKIRGSYVNVVGLPVSKVYDLFKELDLIEL
ncbi:MAG: septum formation protein Maf [Cyclobacteriaceae bacterium]|nr:septum formation protein Maf [Cyclobacteriaceae bacterium]